MYGLEKEKQSKFSFDLEKELKEKPDKAKKTLKMVDDKIHEIKTLLRTGTNEQDFDRLGVLLHGYAALQKVLKKVTK